MGKTRRAAAKLQLGADSVDLLGAEAQRTKIELPVDQCGQSLMLQNDILSM